MKGLIKVFSGGSALWKEWRMIGLLKECVGSHSLGRAGKKWIDTVKDFKKKRVGCQAS